MVDSMKTKLEEESADLNAQISELDSTFESLKGDLMSQRKSSKSWDKSGYLFERKQPKGLNPVSWLRTYCVLYNGVFTVYNFSRQRARLLHTTFLHYWIYKLIDILTCDSFFILGNVCQVRFFASFDLWIETKWIYRKKICFLHHFHQKVVTDTHKYCKNIYYYNYYLP